MCGCSLRRTRSRPPESADTSAPAAGMREDEDTGTAPADDDWLRHRDHPRAVPAFTSPPTNLERPPPSPRIGHINTYRRYDAALGQHSTGRRPQKSVDQRQIRMLAEAVVMQLFRGAVWSTRPSGCVDRGSAIRTPVLIAGHLECGGGTGRLGSSAAVVVASPCGSARHAGLAAPSRTSGAPSLAASAVWSSDCSCDSRSALTRSR